MGHSAGAQLAALMCIDDRYVKAEGVSFDVLKGCVPVDGDTYDLPAVIALSHQPLQLAQEWFAPMAIGIHGRDIVVKRSPSGPDSEPVETVILEIVEVAANEILGCTECPVVADAEQERRLSVQRELRAVDP